MSESTLIILMQIAGGLQLSIAAGSTAIPKVLGWSSELQAVSPLTRRLFWVYAGYIFCFNLMFGLLCTFGAEWLIAPHPLAVCLLIAMSIYWGARVLIQVFLFDKSIRPQGFWYDVAEWSLLSAFVFLAGWFITVLVHVSTNLGA
jgi:hypothetical protein